MAFKPAPCSVSSFGVFGVLFELDGFLAAKTVRSVVRMQLPKDDLQRGLRRRPSMLEHIRKGLQQQQLLNRHLRVEREPGIRYVERGGKIQDIRSLRTCASRTGHTLTLLSSCGSYPICKRYQNHD